MENKKNSRKRAKFSENRADRISQGNIQAFFDSMPFYVLLLDSEHHILMINRAAEQTFGKSQELLIGGYCPEVVHGTSEPYPGCPLEESLITGHAVERDFFDPETKRWINSAIYPTGERTAAGLDIFLHFIQDITERKRIEDTLREKEEELRLQSENLQDVNTALHVLLNRREQEQKQHEANMQVTLEKLVLPYVEKFANSRLDRNQRSYLKIIKSNLASISTPFAYNLSSLETKLSPTEWEIADLLRHGRTTKEIASDLNVSVATVSVHRHHIRKKLGLTKNKVNLTTYLRSHS